MRGVVVAMWLVACSACGSPPPAPEVAPELVPAPRISPAPPASVAPPPPAPAPSEGQYCAISASGSAGRRSAVAHVRLGEIEVTGPLDREHARRVVQRHLQSVRSCYETALAERPDLACRLEVRFVVDASGAVLTPHVTDDAHARALDACVAAALSSWTFPALAEGMRAHVHAPFMLDTAAEE